MTPLLRADSPAGLGTARRRPAATAARRDRRHRSGACRRARWLTLVVAAGSALGLAAAACSSAPEAAPPAPAEILATAKANADAASSVHVVITSRDVPESAEGVIGLDGVGTHAPAFAGVIDARIRGVRARVDTVAVDGSLYLKLPFAPRHVAVDPARYQVPDPATLFSRDRGLTTLLTRVDNPVEGEGRRAGPDVLRTFTGTVPGVVIGQLLHVGDTAQAYDVTYGVTDGDLRLRTAAITGPFFPGARSTFDAVFDEYGEPVAITRP